MEFPHCWAGWSGGWLGLGPRRGGCLCVKPPERAGFLMPRHLSGGMNAMIPKGALGRREHFETQAGLPPTLPKKGSWEGETSV